MSPKHPLDDVDDGNPYGGASPVTPDFQGGTRVIPGEFRPGAPPRLVEDPANMRIGTTGRASLNVEHPTKPVDLREFPYNPMSHVGAVPKKFAVDPRRQLGSPDTELYPEHVVYAQLKVQGAKPWMFNWVWVRGQNGHATGALFLRQCALLFHYGDVEAGKLYQYASQVNAVVRQAMQSAEQSARARLARSIGR